MKSKQGKKNTQKIFRCAMFSLLALTLALSLLSCEGSIDKLRQELLSGVIAEAEALVPDEWKPSAYTEVEGALAALQEALNAEKPDEEAILSAKDALEEAISTLEKAADKTALQKEYDRLSKLSRTGYTETSVKSFDAALEDAKTLLANGDAEQEDVDRAVKTLTTAEKELARPDKTALQTEYDRLSALSLTGYTKASTEPLTAALTDAAAILADEEASEESVNTATATLKTAEEGLARPDKTALQAEYDRLSALSLTGYTKSSAEPLTEALADTVAILADEEVSEDSVNTAVASLKTAEEGLARPDKSGLQAEYDRLSAVSLTGYTEKSAKAMKTALESAAAVLADGEASEESIASAAVSLKSAEEGLAKKKASGSSQTGTANGGGQSGSGSGNSAGGSSSGGNSSSGNSAPDVFTKAGRLEIAKAEARKWVAENVKPGMTKMDIVEEIAYWFPRYVAWQTNQGTEAYKTNYGNEAYSAFVMKISACSGTCRAIKLICDEAGLVCEHVNEGEWEHQWLRIQVDDGSWKIVDGQCGYVGDTEIGNYAPTPYYYVKWRQADYDEVINQVRNYYETLQYEDFTFTWDESLQYDESDNPDFFYSFCTLDGLGVSLTAKMWKRDNIEYDTKYGMFSNIASHDIRVNCYQVTMEEYVKMEEHYTNKYGTINRYNPEATAALVFVIALPK